MKRVFFTSVLLLALVAIGSALYLDPTVPCPPGASQCPRTWSYKNATWWGSQCPAWEKCSHSAHQSPIDVTSQPLWNGWTPKNLHFKFATLNEDTYLFNTGNYYVLAVNPSQTTQSFEFNGDKYYLNRIEFHSPSQHLLNGKRFDMEAQLFHVGGFPAKTVAVSIFFSRSSHAETNAFIDRWVWSIPEFCTCVDQSCPKPVCGNGVVEGTESCDTGKNNSNTANACRTDCCLPACGDGILDSNEECDDSNNQNGDGCSSICRNECGNGRVNPSSGEQCDNGRNNSNTTPNACRANCQLPTCGDGVTDPARNETCDAPPFGVCPGQCRTNCVAPKCGDGITDPGEECDYAGQNAAGFYCQTNCSCACGNGRIEEGEDCDLGGQNNNQQANAGCRGACFARRCGDGIIDEQFGEECDSIYFDENDRAIPNIYCTTDCKLRCGNDIVEPGEECDAGLYNGQGNNNCTAECKWTRCGDGEVQPDEECDDGDLNSDSEADACRTNCELPRCGDGVVDSGEACDSTSDCTAVCLPLCGNGFVDAGEECDYGWANNNFSPDSCRPNCKLPKCGDGIKDTLEECDSASNGDSPNSCRADCTLPYCGDGIADTKYGELCDNGALNSETDPFGCSPFCLPNHCNSRPIGRKVDLSLAFPHNQTAYSYTGSWTHPPCGEGVQWIIFGEVQDLTSAQFQSLTNSPNCQLSAPRPPQPVAGRKVSVLADPPAARCGNGIKEDGEQCDIGLRNSDWEANKCRHNCMSAHCGDGVTDRGEECDDGMEGSHRCQSDCKLVPVMSNPFASPAWSYDNSCKWSMLSSRWSACASERPASAQSPINIDTHALHEEATGIFGLNAHYTSAEGHIYNTGRTVAVTTSGSGNVLSQEGKSYYLRRIEFHSPSEHTLNGYHADLEAVFLHSADDGKQATVSVLYNRSSKASEFLDQFWFSLPQDSTCACGNGVLNAGEECDEGVANSDHKQGACRTDCTLPRCGDGVLDRGEECDEAHRTNQPNECRANCRLPFCGDGIVDSGEECDFASRTGPACDRECHLLCGNGLVEGNEQCDDGDSNSDTDPLACNTDCTRPHCGDGKINGKEECDDGVLNTFVARNSYCRTDCTLPVCGDGILDTAFGEECDDGDQNSQNGRCLPSCHLNCGSGIMFVNSFKECDEGDENSNADGASCRTNCKRAKCGDNIVDYSKGEECDHGPAGSHACTTTCKLRCGNAELEEGEQCDHGVNNDDTTPNACRTDCRAPYCGDGVRDATEQCDFGTSNSDASGAPCRRDCTLPRCGDGVTDLGEEECDDGNHKNGDGCSATCHRECGNGRRDGNEECDNGHENADAPNACRTDCTLPDCGDGIVDEGEQCDTGARADHPNACRKGCTLPVCGDGIVDSYYGEECDAGAQNSDYSGECSSNCKLNSCRRTQSGSFSFESLWDKTSPVVHYSGSLSAPPCTEGVSVFVFEKVQSISEHQYNHFKALLPHDNARGVQPLHHREVSYTRTAPTTCGDCKVQGNEECDSGDNNAFEKDKCRPDCKKPKCGDGITDSGEECDEGPRNSAGGLCSPQCKLITTCPSSPCLGAPCGVQAPAAKCPCAAQEMNNSGTIININFANLLRGAGCSGSN